MTPFNLQIITPDGFLFDDKAEMVVVRTTVGDKGILARHEPYSAALGTGKVKVTIDGTPRFAALSSGIITVKPDKTVILAQSCEWGNQIDAKRAEAAKSAAEEKLSNPALGANEQAVAEAKLKRALNRLDVAQK